MSGFVDYCLPFVLVLGSLAGLWVLIVRQERGRHD